MCTCVAIERPHRLTSLQSKQTCMRLTSALESIGAPPAEPSDWLSYFVAAFAAARLCLRCALRCTVARTFACSFSRLGGSFLRCRFFSLHARFHCSEQQTCGGASGACTDKPHGRVLCSRLSPRRSSKMRVVQRCLQPADHLDDQMPLPACVTPYSMHPCCRARSCNSDGHSSTPFQNTKKRHLASSARSLSSFACSRSLCCATRAALRGFRCAKPFLSTTRGSSGRSSFQASTSASYLSRCAAPRCALVDCNAHPVSLNAELH